MSTQTTNYGLVKPLQTETYDVDVFNKNMDILDAKLKLLEKLSTPEIGDLIVTKSGTNPSEKYVGTTWVLVKEGTYLRSAGSTIKVGTITGSDTVTLTTDNLPSHSHTVTIGSGGSHNHSGSIDSQGWHNHTGTTDTTNLTGSHNTYVYGEGGAGGVFSLDLNTTDGADLGGSYKSNFATIHINASHNHSFTTNGSGAHAHNLTINNGGDHAHTCTISSTGNGKAINICPTNEAFYLWERTA